MDQITLGKKELSKNCSPLLVAQVFSMGNMAFTPLKHSLNREIRNNKMYTPSN